MPAASLEITGLSAGYGQTRVLEDVSFAVPAGSRLAVLGRNGMGKTTLFATIAGQTRRYSGAIRLGDKDSAISKAPRGLEAGWDMCRRRAAYSPRSLWKKIFRSV
jgi:branched-chain amino acid transport system ATP-binding protein